MSACCTANSNCSLARAMGGRIMRCGIISSCQSAATSETLKRSYYLRQVNGVNGRDIVFVRCVCVCACMCRCAADRSINQSINQSIIIFNVA